MMSHSEIMSYLNAIPSGERVRLISQWVGDKTTRKGFEDWLAQQVESGNISLIAQPATKPVGASAPKASAPASGGLPTPQAGTAPTTPAAPPAPPAPPGGGPPALPGGRTPPPPPPPARGEGTPTPWKDYFPWRTAPTQAPPDGGVPEQFDPADVPRKRHPDYLARMGMPRFSAGSAWMHQAAQGSFGRMPKAGAQAASAAAGDPSAIPNLAAQRGEEVIEQFKQMPHNAQKMITSNSAPSTIAGGLGLAENVLNVAGFKPLDKLAGVGKAVFEAIEALRQWGEALHEGHMKLAEFSAGMAQVQAQQISRDIEFDRQRGEARAATAQRLSDSRQRLREALAPYEDKFNDTMSGGLSRLYNYIASLISDKEVKDSGGEGESMAGQAYDEAAGVWAQTYGQPPRFR